MLIGTQAFEAFPKPKRAVGYGHDFLHTDEIDAFTATKTDAAVGAPALISGHPGGAVRLLGQTNTDASGTQLTGTQAQINVSRGPARFQAQFRLVDAFNCQMLVGLVAAGDTSLIASAPANMIVVAKDNDDYTLKLRLVSASGSPQNLDIGDIENDQWCHVSVQASPTQKEVAVWAYTINAAGAETLLNHTVFTGVTMPVGDMADAAAFLQKVTSGTLHMDLDYLDVEGVR